MFWLGVLLAACCCVSPVAAQVKPSVCPVFRTVTARGVSSTRSAEGSFSDSEFILNQGYDVPRPGPGSQVDPMLEVYVSNLSYFANTGLSTFFTGGRTAPIQCMERTGTHFSANCAVPANFYFFNGSTSQDILGTVSIQFDVNGKKVKSSSSSMINRVTDLTTPLPSILTTTTKFESDQYVCSPSCSIEVTVKDSNNKVLFFETFIKVTFSAGMSPRC